MLAQYWVPTSTLVCVPNKRGGTLIYFFLNPANIYFSPNKFWNFPPNFHFSTINRNEKYIPPAHLFQPILLFQTTRFFQPTRLFQLTRLFGTLGIDAAKLIAASVMAAPAALAVSKLFYPETEKTKTSIDEIKLEKGSEANVLDAAAQGASTAIMLVLNIGASLIAFLAFVECINHIIGNFSVESCLAVHIIAPRIY